MAELTGLEPAAFAVTGRCSNQLRYNSVGDVFYALSGSELAELTGLEPATFAVTGRCSNQLRYNSSSIRPSSFEQCFKLSPACHFASPETLSPKENFLVGGSVMAAVAG